MSDSSFKAKQAPVPTAAAGVVPQEKSLGGADTSPACVIDSFGFVRGIPGWFFIGKINRPAGAGRQGDVSAVARFDRGGFAGRAILAFFNDPDQAEGKVGFIALLRGADRPADSILDLRLQFPDGPILAQPGPTTYRLPEQDLLTLVREILVTQAVADANRIILLRAISRPLYRGEDTTAGLPDQILLAFDEMILCPPDGLVVIGWRVLIPGSSYVLRLRSGQKTTEFAPEDGVRVARPDVVQAIGQEWDFVEMDCGFLVYLPGAYSSGETTYIEIETPGGAIAFKNLALSAKRGMGAIKRVLQDVDVRYGAMDASFDQAVGPAITALNLERLRARPVVTELVMGDPNPNPSHSVIIPLYGRIDFIEYQLALFSREPSVKNVEFIYVLDDPSRRRDLEILAVSAHERFGIPIRVLLLNRNLGYAPANNEGLRRARGRYVCFLNSDAFPLTLDWLPRLTDQIERRPEIGTIGPRLLYEDGSVQHEGCYYHPLAEFGGWTFVGHTHKGRRPGTDRGLRICPAITGACMILERELALELGGFDEAYVVGDFEDSDLCQKIRARGLECAVDLDVEMYHLERKSQAQSDQTWRQHLTLYNAWVHQRRWFTPAKALETIGE